MVSTTFSGREAGRPTTLHRSTTSPLSLRALAVIFAVLTGLLMVDAMVQPLAPFDLWGINRIQRIDLPYLETIIRPFDAITSSTGAIVTWALALLAFVVARKWLPALAVLVLPIGGLVNNLVSEVLVGRTRPHGYDEIIRTVTDVEAASFPSGHTMGAVMLYGLVFFLARDIQRTWLRLPVQIGAMAVIGIVGFARIWYGAHWPSDVLGAYALGGLLLAGIIWAYGRIDLAVGDIPFILAARVPHDEDQPHAHALTSTVIFNGDTVSKVYAPGFVPRAVYWLAYQAEFPYIRNRAVLPHLGAHLVITVFLRFPFGSIARVAWTGYALGAATTKLIARKIDRHTWKQTLDIHSPLVLLLAAIPGFGAFAYLAAKPVRSNQLMMRVTLDAVMHKVPWKLYERSGMQRLIARPAGTAPPEVEPVPVYAYCTSDPGAIAAGGD